MRHLGTARWRRRGRMVLGATIVAVGTVGCSAKVEQEVFDREMASIRQELDELDGRVADNRDGIAGNAAGLAELRRDLQALEQEFEAKITEIENGLRFAMPVHFEFDRFDIRSVDRPTLDRFAAVVKKHYPGSRVTVEGFADPAGSAAYNEWLSGQRAETVAAYLTGPGGLDAEAVRTAAYGESRQVVEGAQGPGREGLENRRVTFVIEFGGEGQPLLEPRVAESASASG